jgi:hypothetical protein
MADNPSTMNKKIKLFVPPEIYRLAKAKAEREGKTLEEWLTAIMVQQLHKDTPLDWGRIDSRIDQRTISLEHRLDNLAEQLDRLSRCFFEGDSTGPESLTRVAHTQAEPFVNQGLESDRRGETVAQLMS